MFFISNLVPLSSFTCLLSASTDTGSGQEFLWHKVETPFSSWGESEPACQYASPILAELVLNLSRGNFCLEDDSCRNKRASSVLLFHTSLKGSSLFLFRLFFHPRKDKTMFYAHQVETKQASSFKCGRKLSR